MAYPDLTSENVHAELGVASRHGDLFGDLRSLPVSVHLQVTLERGRSLWLSSEKARCEFIVAPILLEARELSGRSFTIYSGQRLDVDPARRLQGECDFILSRSEKVPYFHAPLMAVVEAKKQDMEAGLGQCIAQMVAAQLFNERANEALKEINGCVTTGDL